MIGSIGDRGSVQASIRAERDLRGTDPFDTLSDALNTTALRILREIDDRRLDGRRQ
jgi:hypothetical protein